MNGTLLRFYVHENRRQGYRLLYEWLLERAKAMGIGGGSALRAVAGFGRHGVMHEERFFELAGDVPVVVEFIVRDDEADALVAAVRDAGIEVFYMRVPVTFAATEAGR
jgi:PII-like signaling protein